MNYLTQQLTPDGLKFDYQKKNIKLLVKTRDEYISTLEWWSSYKNKIHTGRSREEN